MKDGSFAAKEYARRLFEAHMVSNLWQYIDVHLLEVYFDYVFGTSRLAVFFYFNRDSRDISSPIEFE